MAEPRFKPGDRVIIVRGGRGHVWRVVREVTGPTDAEPAYALQDGQRARAATESALQASPYEVTPSERSAWWDRHADG